MDKFACSACGEPNGNNNVCDKCNLILSYKTSESSYQLECTLCETLFPINKFKRIEKERVLCKGCNNIDMPLKKFKRMKHAVLFNRKYSKCDISLCILCFMIKNKKEFNKSKYMCDLCKSDKSDKTYVHKNKSKKDLERPLYIY